MSPAFLNIFERSYAETFFQSVNALLAASKAISKSCVLACETLPITSSVAGFIISRVSFDIESLHSPFINSWVFGYSCDIVSTP